MNLEIAQSLMAEKKVDVLVVGSPDNVLYTSGLNITHTVSNRSVFISLAGAPIFPVIPQQGDPTIVVPEAASELAQDFSSIKDIRPYKSKTMYRKWPPSKKFYDLEPIDLVVRRDTHHQGPTVDPPEPHGDPRGNRHGPKARCGEKVSSGTENALAER